jgi:uncharacterized repeat protein (TIGR01451 family)
MSSYDTIRKLGWALCVLAGLSAFGTSSAQASGALAIQNAVYQEIEVKAPDGKVTKKMVPAGKVVPGGEVVYEITYRNTGKDVATDIAINNPLAKEVTYVGASTAPTAVSVDGGAHFGALADLSVTGADGKPRKAQPADVTHLRWVVATLAPGASGKVEFRARVK